MSLALMEGYDLRGVLMDRHGLIPERLDAAFRESGPAVLYCTPTLQAATGSLMPLERRAEIAEIVAHHDGWIVEDDAYGFLPPGGVQAAFGVSAPERSVYIVSFAKCLSPSLRVGAMVAPRGHAGPDRQRHPVDRMDGEPDHGGGHHPDDRERPHGPPGAGKARRRRRAHRRSRAHASVRRSDLMSDVPAFHVWMRLPPGRAPVGLMAQAAQAGITVARTHRRSSRSTTMGNGVRICLGGAPGQIRRPPDGALETLGDIPAGHRSDVSGLSASPLACRFRRGVPLSHGGPAREAADNQAYALRATAYESRTGRPIGCRAGRCRRG